MIILTVALIIVEFLLIVISGFVKMPEWISVFWGCVLIGDLFFLLRGTFARSTKRLLLSLSVTSIFFSIVSAYATPYWNSIIFRDMAGMAFPQSKDLDALMGPNEAREDWDFAIRQFIKVHPAILDQQKSKDSLQRVALHAGADSISVNQLYQQLQIVAASFRDAHTRVFPVLETLRTELSSFGELCAINDVEREDFASAFGKYISSETQAWTHRSVLSAIHTYEGLKLFGCFSADSVTMSFVAPDETMVRHSLRKDDFRSARAAAVRTLSSDKIGVYAFDDSVSCGILTLDNCYYYTPSQRRKFNKGLRSFFQQMADRQCKRLVIDVRDNPGGNVEIVRELFRYLPLTEYGMGERYHRYASFMLGGKRVRRNRPFRDLCFKGEVYVLTSLSTFSAAMHLADYLQANKVARLVGESPGNTPTCYTDMTHFVLPHSKLSLTISTGKFVRADNTCLVNVLKPDISCVAETAYETLKSQFQQNDQSVH